MTFTHLPAVARHIRKCHDSFAGEAAENVLNILGKINNLLQNCTGCVAVTVPAHITNGPETFVRFRRDERGAWEVLENTNGVFPEI